MFEGRSQILRFSIFLVGFIFLLRLFYIQIIDSQYKIFAESNALRKETIIPARGLIYDRKGKIIVNNETSYDVMVNPSRVRYLDTSLICKILDVDKEDFRESFTKAVDEYPYHPSAIVKGITLSQYGKFQERLYEFPGFNVEARATRNYPMPIAAHVLGYLGEVNDKDIAKSAKYYHMGDYAGRSGLEKKYESELRGVKGLKNILVDVLNREQGSYQHGKMDIPAVAGKDLVTGLDLDLQAYGEKLMQGRKGSIIAIEPSTGEVLAMISFPAYDPNELIGRKRASNIGRLMIDRNKPMFNRAISAMYPPGSTFKPVMGLLALDEHIITPSTTFTCAGGYHLSASKIIHCHSSGTFDLHQSIQLSCNGYYCNVFRLFIDQRRNLNAAKGIEHWSERLMQFGLGQKLGIDIPNETKAIIPTYKLYNKAYGEGRWKSSTVISLGIGQAEICFTPLQIANVAATIANGGYYITPHFVRGLDKSGTIGYYTWPRKTVPVDPQYFPLMQSAMQAVVDHGTAILARVKGIEVCGKTGTAQNPHGEDHSLFMGFAPRVNPRIAIAVVIENAGMGGTWAAPMGGLMIEKYLKDSITDPMSKWSEKRILDAARPAIFVADTGSAKHSQQLASVDRHAKSSDKHSDPKKKVVKTVRQSALEIDTNQIQESDGTR